ncbi:hypothetical protein HI914_04203 [Erysiphe necator]|uniref:Putative alba domain containing protein n=1 Tax=Uncinula necator TaxID=52586 RepID=A0A0B1P129_UNCNE|nr:hypothetical protein HI914_04203 [Erysiphe necator]KHJ32312.1 putative alba domain containing protein [Erysiphe necator]
MDINESKVTKSDPTLIKKLPRLSKGFRISKRPLLHPPIASRYSSTTTSKVIYISNKSSFIGTIKRVRLFLEQIRSRSFGNDNNHIKNNSTSLLSQQQNSTSNDVVLTALSKAIKEGENKNGKKIRDEEVIMKAGGKAIEKGLRLAAWWSSQSDVKVELRTGSVGAVDDIVDEDGVEESSRVRNMSYLEVAIKLI